MTAIANRAAALPIRNREPFHNHTGSFFGLELETDHPQTGILPFEWREKFAAATTLGTYVVYSYQTPIAWWSHIDQAWIVPDVKYSVTTSRHQSAVRVGISAPATYFDQFKTEEVAR